jgi:putative ABC transport system ATP-binding protein
MDVAADTQIRLERIGKAYGPHVVLRDVDLSVPAGQFLVVMGRSGSGKSTLLKLIGGLDAPDTGTVIHGLERLDRMTEDQRASFRRRRLGFVFQFFNLIPTLTVGENVRLPLELNGFAPDESRARAAALLDELEVRDCADRFPDELSGGEQQRAAIARALIHEPGLVIADEPTGNLDLDTAGRVLERLTESCRSRGTTLIVATHSLDIAHQADRVLGIRDARLEDVVA